MKITVREVIKRADELRDNAISEEQKAAWLYELEGKVAEVMGLPAPENAWPEDSELLMPSPYDNIYELYLISMIDHHQMDGDLYTNDRVVFNEAFAEARAWWIRNNRPKNKGNWRV